MTAGSDDTGFAGSIPDLYQSHLVPLIFEPYAADLAARVARRTAVRVLEVAAGTGVVTRQLASVLPPEASIVATDLNPPMLDKAASLGAGRSVEWRQADALALPFPDASFDAVVCQFGVMFFPDTPTAFAEARRVLRPGGAFLFNVWDAIDQNELSLLVTRALANVFPDDPPRFMARVPHGYCDPSHIVRDLAGGGFTGAPEITLLAARSRADAALAPAVAYCQGTPLRSEIEARATPSLTETTERVCAALVERFGSGPVDAKLQALVVEVEC